MVKMVKHIEINCFEFGEYTLNQRKKAIRLQMEQYIKLLSMVIKNLEEDKFKIDFIIKDEPFDNLEIDFNIDYKTDIKEEFLKKFEEVMEYFNINTNKITFIINKKILV
jgi:hypothetical protein